MKKINTVLLIDDDKATNFITRMLIKKADITDHIEITLNGQEALDYLTNSGKYEKPDSSYPQPMLIFLDINMPVMDGWEFADAFSKLQPDQKGGAKIIMLTSSLNPDDKERASKLPAIAGFQSKILTMEGLTSILDQYFS
ncbi:response regulator [Flavobacterium aquicola]|uniref:CheY-like chemotaxis protein n=1 Tax=Flavobacterium aquicola TaxID=1682742 RepID=A0A3E0EER5_9FLAO|nr:response regulator [Flavobacterium aquicola]REG96213.1 CheY-like chemotaxis protein [Flavobacterium aquicola]